MNKKIIVALIAVLFVVIILLIALVLKLSIGTKAQMPEEKDFVPCITNYLIDKEKVEIESFKTFADVSVIKTKKDKEDEDTDVVLTWLDVESYFVDQDGIVQFYSGYEDIYEFKIKNNEIIFFDKKNISDISKKEKAQILQIRKEGIVKNNILTQIENYYSIQRDQIYY